MGDEGRSSAGSISLELNLDTSELLEQVQSSAAEAGNALGDGLSEGAGRGAAKAVEEAEKGAEKIKSATKKAAKDVGKEAETAGEAISEGISEGAEKGSDSAGKAVEKGAERVKKASKSASDSVIGDAAEAGSSIRQSAASSVTGIVQKLQGLASMAAKAFAVKKLVDFGKEAIELGSDLSEVQNVVDVTFGSMTDKVDEFAKSAATSFGLSETMAKRYTGTFGAMSKAFGFSQNEAYDMSTALTGLAGDVASFYNITQDEAYTKLKSVFTGETESLKDLGVVMTQTALDAYAMANGFGKTTAKMTEAEKVALRFSFVQDQLSAASGDFARTSGSWANQVRLLKLQFDSLKASIGQGLINVLLPVVKSINFVLGKLTTLANAFKSFTELITGNKSSGSGGGITDALGDISDASGSAADGLDAATGAADDAADASSAAGKAAKKAAKDMLSLAGFDQITKLSEATDDSGYGDDSYPSGKSGGTGGGLGGTYGSAVDYGDLAKGDTVVDKIGNKFQKLIDRAKELAALFKKGFKIGFGDSGKKIASIRAGLDNIGQRLKEIFTDPEVVAAANRMFDSFAYNAGRVAGSFASIGLSIANNLVSGISQYLDESSGYIKERLVGIFNSSAVLAELVGDVSQALATIYDVLNGENAIGCTAALIGIFSDGFLGITDLALRFGTDIISMITGPFVENAELIRTTIDNTLGPIKTILETIWQSVKDTVDKAIEVYNEHVHPMFVSLRDGFTEIVETFLNGYNEYMVPVLEGLAEKFQEVWENHIQPAIDGFIDLFGKVADMVKTVWETVLQPVVNWIADRIWPVVAPILEKIGEAVLGMLAVIADVVTDVEAVLGDLIDFVIDVFEGNWSGAWEDIKNLFGDAWNAMVDLVQGPVNVILDFMQGLLDGVAEMVNGISDAINNLSFEIPSDVPFVGGMGVEFNMPYWSPPSLPRLAEGGYVKANKPRMAIIGDNSTEGEIVSPESKMRQMASDAANKVLNAGKQTDTVSRIKVELAGSGTRKPENGNASPESRFKQFAESIVSKAANVIGKQTDKAGRLQTQLSGYGALRTEHIMEHLTSPKVTAQKPILRDAPKLAMVGSSRNNGLSSTGGIDVEDIAEIAARTAIELMDGMVTRADLESIINNAVMRIIAALAQVGFYIDGQLLARLVKKAMQELDYRYNPVDITG